MKYLSDYTNDAQTAVFEKYGAFFAFSQKQFDEQKKEGVTYTNLGVGLIAPKGTGKQIMDELEEVNAKGIAMDIEENGIKAIIHRELANHECQITMDYDEVVDKLEDYGITREQVQAEWSEFWNHCVENDYF